MMLSHHLGGKLTNNIKNRSQLNAAYNFMKRKDITYKDVIKNHIDNTILECYSKNTVLAIQDTTNISYSKLNSTEGLSYIYSKKSKGLILHSVLAVDGENGTPLGLLHMHFIDRKDEEQGKRRRKNRDITPYEEKESYKWEEGANAVEKAFSDNNKTAPQVILVGDRESDIYEILCHSLQSKIIDCVIRSSYNRTLEGAIRNLNDYKKTLNSYGYYFIDVLNPETRCFRRAKLEVQAGEVSLKMSHHRNKIAKLISLKMNVVYVHEIDSNLPEDKLINWTLFTTLPVDSYESAIKVISYYSSRWRIEDYHKCLKTGLKVEESQLRKASSLQTFIGICSVLAIALLIGTYRHRKNPLEDATILLGKDKIDLLVKLEPKLISKNSIYKLPKRRSLSWAIILIGIIGGYIPRNGKYCPGIKSLWKGFRDLDNITIGYIISKEDMMNS